MSRLPRRFPNAALTAPPRYHVPAHVREHVDYITPGLKLLVPSRTRSDSEKKNLEKRIFGVTAGKKAPILPPLKKALPASLTDILKRALNQICQVAVIPECIDSEFPFSHSFSWSTILIQYQRSTTSPSPPKQPLETNSASLKTSTTSTAKQI